MNLKDNNLIHIAFYFVATVALILIYLPSTHYELFIFDDLFHVQRAAELSQLNQFSLSPFSQVHTGIPVFYQIWGFFQQMMGPALAPHYLKVLNIVIHLLNTIMLYHLLCFIIDQKKYSQVIFVALLSLIFSLHPIQVESVVWVSSLKGNLALFFAFMTIYSKKHLSKKGNSTTKAILIKIAISFFFCLSLLSKPSLISLPIAFILVDYFLLKKKAFSAIAENIPLLIIAILIGFYHIWTYSPGFLHHLHWHLTHPFKRFTWLLPLALAGLAFASFLFYILPQKYKRLLPYASIIPILLAAIFYYKTLFNSIAVFGYQIYKILIPHNFAFDYGFNETYLNQIMGTTSQLAILIVVVSMAIYYRQKKITLLIFVLYVLSFPFLGFLSFEFASISMFADRFAYPILAALLAVATLAFQIKPKYNFLILLILPFITVQSYALARKWETSQSYLNYSLSVNSQSIPMHLALAHDYDSKGNLQEAIRHYDLAYAINPNTPETYLAKIYTLLKYQKFQEVIQYVDIVINNTDTVDARIFPSMGKAYLSIGDFENAIFYLNLALKENPHDIFSLEMREFIQAIRPSTYEPNE